MMKKYSGWYVVSGMSNIMEQISPRYSMRYYGSLTIDTDKLVVKMKGKETVLPKTAVKNIESQFIGRFKINHSDTTLPDFLIFSAWWPFGLSRKLRESGYSIK